MSDSFIITIFAIVFGTIILLAVFMLIFSHISTKKTKKTVRKAVKCESCGAPNEVTSGEISTCSFCGSKIHMETENDQSINDISKIIRNMQETITNAFDESDKK